MEDGAATVGAAADSTVTDGAGELRAEACAFVPGTATSGAITDGAVADGGV